MKTKDMIREANRNDRDAILALARCFRQDARQWLPPHLRGESSWEECVSYIDDLLISPDTILAVAEARESICAVGCLRIGSGHATISDVIVHPEQRKRGLGSTLVHWLEERAFGHGVTSIDLEVAAGNSAREFYAKLGYEPVTIRMRKLC